MKRTLNDQGLGVSEWFFVFLILLLIVLTGAMAYLIQEMGPDDDPEFAIEEVYLEQKGTKTYTAYLYITNLGKSKADSELRWKLMKDPRLIDNGSKPFTIDGRSTNRIQITFNIGRGDDSNMNLKMKVLHNSNTMYTKDYGFTP